MRKYAVLSAVVFTAACQDSTSPSRSAAAPARANPAQSALQNDYIVTFRDDEPDPEGHARALTTAYGGSVKFVYRAAIKGFAVAGLPDAAIDALRRNPAIVNLERDGIVTADGSGTQSPATWGIDRIDQTDLPLDNAYGYDTDGAGVTAYIIDTGIRTTHTEFGGRASGGYTAITDGNGTNDCNGHGTHVAGTVGGSTYGVAKRVSLVAVRVLNCSGSGTTSGVVAGIDWVTANHAPNAVANMSLGGSFSSTLNNAVANSINAGVTFGIAAGNSNADACNYSPASTPAAITVGATTSSDAKASYSNYGTCVDINAPGSSITSAWSTSDIATNTISGTSMATPHVVGAAALYLSGHLGSAPSQVASALTGSATTGHVSGLPSGTPNLLLYTHFGTSSPPPPPSSTLTASFTKSCSSFTCTFTSTSQPAASITGTSWIFEDGQTLSGTSVTRSFSARLNYPFTLKVTDGTSSASTSGSVSCNPKKCQ